jgi:hypothetical protein
LKMSITAGVRSQKTGVRIQTEAVTAFFMLSSDS